MGLDTEILAFAVLAFFIAGTIKGVVGLGLPTTSVGLLGQFVDPRVAIALVTMPMVVSNLWQVWREGDVLGTIRRFTPFWAPLVVLLYVTAFVTASVSDLILLTVIGSVIVTFASISLAWTPPALPPGWDRPAQITAGSIAGVLGGLTSIWSPPMIVYFLAARVDKDTFVRASGVLLMLGTGPMVAGYWTAGILTSELALVSATLVIPTLIGFTVGEWLRRRLDTERFRRVVLWIFLAMGLNILRRAVMG